MIELSGVLKIGGCLKKGTKKEKTYLENMSTHNVDLTALSRSVTMVCAAAQRCFTASEQENSGQMPVRHRGKQKENKGYLESVGKYFIVMHRVF